jgi:hypothetical protein
MYGVEQNPKLGYYRVGDRTFYSKPEAYIYATEVGVDPIWHFNNAEFAKCNWDIEPETNIRELYRLRALQLREKYDWIRIEASGGGDSTTAIFSFLLNGIHLDEVVFRYPEQLDKDVTNDPFNTRPENTLSERQFAAEPLFRWINTNFPNVKTTVQDYSENLLKEDYMKDESWVFTTRDWFQPGHGIKHNNFGTIEHRNLADSGKKICALYGIDKPKLTVIDGKWYFYFSDLQANHPNPITGDYSNITTELFYWSPDMPELLLKQAHMIRSWFEMPQNQHLKHLVTWPNHDPAKRTAYEHIAKSIIYPDYDLETWQTAKPTTSFYNEMDHWFHVNLEGTKIFDAWQAGLQFLLDKINNKYFIQVIGQPAGLQQNTSTFYYIGPELTVQNPTVINRNYISNTVIPTVINKKLVKINTRASE